MVRDIGKNYIYVLWFTSLGNGSKCLPVSDCFSGCYFFHTTIFLTFLRNRISAYSLLPIARLFNGFLLLDDGTELLKYIAIHLHWPLSPHSFKFSATDQP